MQPRVEHMDPADGPREVLEAVKTNDGFKRGANLLLLSPLSHFNIFN